MTFPYPTGKGRTEGAAPIRSQPPVPVAAVEVENWLRRRAATMVEAAEARRGFVKRYLAEAVEALARANVRVSRGEAESVEVEVATKERYVSLLHEADVELAGSLAASGYMIRGANGDIDSSWRARDGAAVDLDLAASVHATFHYALARYGPDGPGGA